MQPLIIPIGVSLLLFTQLVAAQGNLIYNGGFDITTGNDAAGWTRTGSAFANGKNGNPAPDFVLGLGQAVSQTVNNLIPDSLYTVYGDYSCYASDQTTLSFRVSVDGVAVFETTAPIDQSWTHFSVTFIPASSSVVLSLSQTYWAYLSVDNYSIDNIGIAVVPEPGCSWLFIVGFFSLLWRSKPDCQRIEMTGAQRSAIRIRG